ncbi:hypothetical protein CCO0918 [Campylobacter coli RM2228]|nr:hypothetical protein CCO0918 [Campylobacter coli RM2228]
MQLKHKVANIKLFYATIKYNLYFKGKSYGSS